jgi:hypothetical protein
VYRYALTVAVALRLVNIAASIEIGCAVMNTMVINCSAAMLVLRQGKDLLELRRLLAGSVLTSVVAAREVRSAPPSTKLFAQIRRLVAIII